MKKVLTQSFATLFIFLASGLLANINADEWTEKVVADKKFEINKNAKLVVDHEFGNVRCTNWDKNSISIKVTVKAKTTDAQKAEKLINNVIVDLTGNKDKVTVECELNQKDSKNKNISVNIDLEIFMPSTISLELENKFGTAYIESVSGPTKITSEYGSLEIGSLSNSDNELEVMFGEAQINNINEGKVEIGYSQLKIQKSNILSIESEYSDLSVDNAQSLNCELEGGVVAFGQVNKLDLETTFTTLEVGSLSQSLNAEIEYGTLNIKSLDKDFKSIKIENSYAAINLTISNGTNSSFNIEGEFVSVNYPKQYANSLHKSESDFSTSVKGIIGSDKNPKSSIAIESNYGSVNLKTK